jgi:hypothetical protein
VVAVIADAAGDLGSGHPRAWLGLLQYLHDLLC